MTAKKKPAKKRTVTLWAFAWKYEGEHPNATATAPLSYARRVRKQVMSYRGIVGPIVRIEVPLPSRGTR